MSLRVAYISAALVIVAACGGFVAEFAGLPMPFMMGGLISAAAVVLALPRFLPDRYRFPEAIRRFFVALVGALIGASFTPELLRSLDTIWISFLFVTGFIVTVQSMNFWLYRRIGKYDRPTAYYAAMPGGLIEAAILGEAAGGDPRLLTIQHFVRIVLTILIVPLLFLVISGEAVGSSAGVQLVTTATRNLDILIIVAIAVVGLLVGEFIRLPARQFIWPLLVSAAVHVTGSVETASPGWVIEMAQVVIGAGLGAKFSGVSRPMLLRALGMGTVSVTAMLVVGALFALAATQVIAQPFEVLFVSFAPGGVTEMSLIALSLAANPAFVSAHHMFRISVTVFLSGFLARLFGIGSEHQPTEPEKPGGERNGNQQ